MSTTVFYKDMALFSLDVTLSKQIIGTAESTLVGMPFYSASARCVIGRSLFLDHTGKYEQLSFTSGCFPSLSVYTPFQQGRVEPNTMDKNR